MGVTDVAGKAAIGAWLDALCSGKGPRAVAQAAGCRQKDARALGERLRSELPSVFKLKMHLEEAGRRRGWVQTPMGRRRRFEPRYTSRDALSEVLATAGSDAFKLGLRRLWQVVGGHLVLAVGTTALLEADNAEALDVAREVCQQVRLACENLPWPCEIATALGDRWTDLKMVQKNSNRALRKQIHLPGAAGHFVVDTAE